MADPDEALLARVLASLPADDDAFRRLLTLWNVRDAVAGAQGCAEAEANGLNCLSGSGGWAELRRYDRPALLSLRADDGSEREVLLRSLSGEIAVLDLPEGPRPVNRNVLAARWGGDFLLLWRPPLGETLIGPSSQGAAVRWLRAQLALADAQPAPDGPSGERFDEALRKRIRVFQTARGVTADGLAGARTLILLSNLGADVNSPRLRVVETGG